MSTNEIMNTNQTTETVTLGGGCFWCLDAVYKDLRGVESAISGYMGGKGANPTYREVCGGDTGHAEVVQVTFDPNEITFREILEVFFTIHDPTTMNRQGADVGTQYRSAIFYHSPEQKQVAEDVIAEFNREQVYSSPLVTELVPVAEFYEAEDYHQDYFTQNPAQPYCQAVVAPKVAKFRRKFAGRLRSNSDSQANAARSL